MGSSEPWASSYDELFEEYKNTSQALKTIKDYSELYHVIEELKLIY